MPSDNCRESFFTSTWKGVDKFYPVIGLILSIPLTLMVIMEFIVDARRRAFQWKMPVLYAKISLLCFISLRVAHFGIWLSRDLNGFNSVSILAESAVSGAGVLFAFLTLALTVLMWTSLVDKVRNMSTSLSKQIKILRRGLIIFTAVYSPAVTILFILQSVGFAAIFITLYNIVLGVGLLLLAIIQLVFSVRIREFLTKASRTSAKISRKNNFFIACDVLTIVLVIVLLVYPFTGFRVLPWHYIGYQFFVRMMEMALTFNVLGATESYLFDSGFLVGYYYGIFGNKDQLALLSTRSTRVNSMSVSSQQGGLKSMKSLKDGEGNTNTSSMNKTGTDSSEKPSIMNFNADKIMSADGSSVSP